MQNLEKDWLLGYLQARGKEWDSISGHMPELIPPIPVNHGQSLRKEKNAQRKRRRNKLV